MTALRLPRPAALATVLLLLVVAIVAFPGEIHSQIGGRVLNPNGVKPTASNVLVTLRGPNGESTRTVIAGRFAFPELPRGTRVTLQAMAQGLVSAPVTATAPDTMVLLVLRATRAGEKFTVMPQGAQTRARPATPAAAPAQDPTPSDSAQQRSQSTATPQGRPAVGNGGSSAQGLFVQEAVFTNAELVDRMPVSVSGCTAAACSTRYADTVGTVIFWTRLAGGSPGRWVEHIWYRGEKEIARVRQKVEGPTWRTWTRKQILPEWTGDWRVEVRAEDGTLLAERFFTVEAQ
jgi:hypothetical protein